jgi:hypothetical protein
MRISFPSLFLLLFAPLFARHSVELKVDRPFPNLVLPSLQDGLPTSISKFRGKKLILQIFASW